ncbi:hypothetical protein FGG08_000372 [Glutinoglossum americanum]|uniref:Xylanolytic transcriptional activator regulatory domain-containing protein n=1 Tax=Glutinoglossum americanum TaxID=1670608 RepID=A0A9P8IFH8_9PEZI|nr:hypothetical protein FGG08_000372 [Glutinoglossum americanum]
MPRSKRQKKAIASDASTSTLPLKDSPRALVDALDSPILTPKVLTELFDIFQLHFSSDLPFLHPPTFLKPLRKTVAMQSSSDTSAAGSNSASSDRPSSPIVLLGLLTLTARFHPELAAYHSPPSPNRPTNPLAASEYYAKALRCHFAGPSGENIGLISLECIQAALMLSLYEWGMCRGIKSWVYGGIATRVAQAMGLQFEQDLDDEPLALSSALTAEAQHLGVSMDRRNLRQPPLSPGEAFIQQETRRRTFWSCFLLDRYLSSGKYRPQMLDIKDIRVQLPSTEHAFLFGERVRTKLLGEERDEVAGREDLQLQRRASVLLDEKNGNAQDDPNHDGTRRGRELESSSTGRGKEYEEKGRWEVGQDEGVQSRVIKIIEIWGRIAKWSCSGGRRSVDSICWCSQHTANMFRNERYAPWEDGSTFFRLRNSLADFDAGLPRNLTFNLANLSAHISSRTSTPYSLMHTVYFLCLVTLHREYIPFVPIRCLKPEGPVDAPVFPPDQYTIPPGFWDNNAKECFRAARNIMELARACKDWGVLVETPIVGFAIYTVAFIGVYCINFPHMDPNGFMSSGSADATTTDANRSTSYPCPESGKGAEEASRAVEILGHMRPRMKMADGWFRTIKRVHNYYVKIKKDYRRNTKALAAASGTDKSAEVPRNLTLREGGAGGGLEVYKLLEKTLKEFGSMEDDDDTDMPDVEAEEDRAESDAGRSNTANAAVKSEAIDGAEGRADEERTASGRERWIAINSVVAAAAKHQDNYNGMGGQGGSGVGSNYSQKLSTPGYQGYGPQYYSSPHSQQVSEPPTPGYMPLGGSATPFSPSHSSPSPRLGTSFGRPDGPFPINTPHTQYHGPAGFVQDSNLYSPATGPPMPQHSSIQAPLPHQWNPEAQQQQKEVLFNQLNQRFGGVDVAAFVDGTSLEDWNNGDGSWLSTVWGGQNL